MTIVTSHYRYVVLWWLLMKAGNIAVAYADTVPAPIKLPSFDVEGVVRSCVGSYGGEAWCRRGEELAYAAVKDIWPLLEPSDVRDLCVQWFTRFRPSATYEGLRECLLTAMDWQATHKQRK